MHHHTFKVEGRLPFPADMLRYDSCWPYSSEDAVNIELSIARETRKVSVKLACYRERGAPIATDRRWSSFSWTVAEIA